ncbi:MAG TPA: hypothetical protein DDY52_03265 [Candidatus Moranbacteria bacterium]|nr:hypothetical protein [Candidatus Moranbacteria bacterium]
MKILPRRRIKSKIPWKLIIDTFKGLASLLDDVILGAKFAKEALNLILVQDGRWKTRWGTAYYGSQLPGNFVACGIYENVDGTQEKIAIGANGKAYKSVDQENWTEITGATFDIAATKYNFVQSVRQLYISNGKDRLTRYNGTNLTRYTPLSAPTGLGLTRNVLTAGSYNNYYKVTALNEVGETQGSAEVNLSTNKPRNAWLPGSSEYLTLTWSAVTGAARYQIYYADESGKELLLAETSTTGLSFKDDGTFVQNPYFSCPEGDTTGAPVFKMIADSGSRLWGITNEFVYWSGTGTDLGVFSEFYGGGYQPLIDGTGENLEWVGHFRNGKGDSVTTVLTRNKAGIGSIWQISLEVTTIADTTIIVPNPVKLPGPIGTVAMLGVIDANDSLYIPNSRGMFSLNNKVNVQNILSTGELSGNIRPSFKGLKNIGNMAGIWYDSKLFWTASESGNGNDIMFGLDTEQDEWLWKWTIGFKSFLEITESNGTTKLLGIPNNGDKLIEISKNIKGDLGKPFYQSWMSGLIPVDDDPTVFAKIQEALVELGRPAGTIYFEILGLSQKGNFSSIATKQITGNLQTIEFWTGDLGEITLKDEEDAPVTYSQASVPSARKVKKTLRAIQFHIYSNSADADFTILKVLAKGMIKKMKTPSNFYKQ